MPHQPIHIGDTWVAGLLRRGCHRCGAHAAADGTHRARSCLARHLRTLASPKGGSCAKHQALMGSPTNRGATRSTRGRCGAMVWWAGAAGGSAQLETYQGRRPRRDVRDSTVPGEPTAARPRARGDVPGPHRSACARAAAWTSIFTARITGWREPYPFGAQRDSSCPACRRVACMLRGHGGRPWCRGHGGAASDRLLRDRR